MSGERYLVTGAGNPNGMLVRCRVLAALQTATDTPAMDGIVADDLGSSYTSRFVAVNNSDICLYAVSYGTYGLVFCSGVRTQRAGMSMWDGYTGSGFLDTVGSIYNTYAESVASQAYPLIPLGSAVTEWYLAGYSAGGVILDSLSRLIRTAYPGPPPVYLLGVGAPKLPINIPSVISRGGSAVNLMCDDDPVPLVPPSISDYQRVMGGLSVFQGQRITSFGAWDEGTNIDPTGSFAGGSTPARLPAPALDAIGSWLAQQANGQLTTHSIQVYLSRLTLALLGSRRVPVTVPVAPPTHTPAPVTVPEIRAALVATQQTIFRDGQRQNQQPVVIPAAQLWTVQRSGKIYRVFFGGIQIATAPRKHRALALKNEGNALIRRLQAEAIVNVDALSQAMAAYLLLASSPGTGFSPQLNTHP